MKSRRIQLKIISDPANLAPVRTDVEALCRENGFDEKAVGEVGLVLNEALANVIRHAYDEATDQPIEVTAEIVSDTLMVRIRDWGSGEDPSRRKPKPHDPTKPGGLGLICMNEWMDEVSYDPQPDGMLLTMKRKKG